MTKAQNILLEVQDLTCKAGKSTILRNVSFSVPEGQYLAIIGPNGAGKSTLLKCLNGIVTDWTGTIKVHNRNIAHCPQRERAIMFGYVPQLRNTMLPFHVREFVLMSRYAHHGPFGSPGKADWEAVDSALERTGTAPLADRTLATLSGGECQKVFIAAALAQEAPTLLLDEPATFLDPRYRHEVSELLSDLNRHDRTTILCVSHELNSAMINAQRVLALKQGTTVFEGPPEEAMTPQTLRNIFGTDFVFAEHPDTHVPVIVPKV